MSYCLNPDCLTATSNPNGSKFCQGCGSKLLLRERYRAIKLIGQGGFGKTFLAVDEDKPSKPRCVIKQFAPQALGTNNAQKAAELFKQEAVRLDELGKHPQIPELLAHFSQDNQQYLVQQFIQGQNLAQALVLEGAFKETQIWELFHSLLPVLKFIHLHNVIHRDIKPANIIRRTDGQIVLVDFGAAKYVTGTALLKTGTTIGTPEYIAPEQIRGKSVFASDLYSLGVTCIYLLTQVSPFDLFDTAEDAWVWRHYLVNNPVSEELGRILDKLIENGTKKRYQSVAEVLEDLNPQKNLAAIAPQQQLPLPPPLRQFSSATARPTILLSSPRLRTQTWKAVSTLTDHLSSIGSVAISPDAQILASGGFDRTIKLWDLKTGKLLNSLLEHSKPVLTVAFSPNGQLLASGSVDNTLKLWSLPAGTVNCTIAGHLDSVISISVAISPDGQAIASGSDDQTIKIWHLDSGELLHTFRNSRGVNSVAISPNGHILASGSSDNSITLWDLGSGQVLETLVGHSRDVNAIAFSPNGRILASGSSDNTIKLWDLNSCQLLSTLEGHSDWVRAVAFSPNRQTLVSGSADATIKLWHLASGEVLHTLEGHSKDVNAIAISPDGQTLVSGSRDHTIKIWQCD
ncbi:serine/threonine-protein kinase [Coleofasciculus sp. FACHB-1120]|uniref:serine/threonine-protein kinase n=1 Tax=Coleofasciculus sp. FACHB-1120 TaxID=2692783 RepID=UPI001689D31E|nr:serine/threonine-protein kinase [Coleofasciculus sp. FACHB-1120]MBD2743586.1 serine/threonine protein kinase [Coleofasciculus sp. FACHB-1120]